MKTNIIILLTLLLFAGNAYADDEVSFTASAPTSVVAGQQFRVTFSVNQEGKDFLAPDMSDFDVLMGPSTSRSSSVQIVNGSVSRSINNSYTYVLVGVEPGKYSLGAAEITIKGKKYTSNVLNIQVLPPDATASSQTQSRNGGTGQGIPVQNPASSSQIPDGEQLFVRTTLSKTKVYEQEALLVTYKLYTRVDLSNIGMVKFPEFKGFYVQDIDLDANRQFVMEHYNGLNYNTIVLKQSVLFPQHAGKLNIESGKVDVTVRVINNNRRSNNIFDSFFDTYSDVNKTLTIPSASVDVTALPSGAPKSFNGAVGSFSLRDNISATEVNANDAVTLNLQISGTGNMRLLKNPEIQFPADFDVYDPKVENKVKTTANGLSGSRNIEYLAIPRFGGEFEIPSVEFSYFDPSAKAYKSLRTKAYKLKVNEAQAGGNNAAAPGNAAVSYSNVNKEDIKNLGSDIRYIHPSGSLAPKGEFFYGSTGFVLALVLPAAAFLLLLIILRRRAKENADVAKRKTKRANKQAKKRLRAAAKFMKAGDKAKFYEETMKALWGYLSDKLSIPLSNLTKDSVKDEMLAHNATEDLADEFLTTLSDCEFARFSPVVDDSLAMDKIYDKAVDLIGKLEDCLK